MTPTNAQWRLAARPVGLPKPSDWEYVEEPAAEPADGQFLVELEYLSLDPAMRGWMNEARSYVPPVGIGEVMRAGGIGRVVDSRHPRLRGRRSRVAACSACSGTRSRTAGASTRVDTDARAGRRSISACSG